MPPQHIDSAMLLKELQGHNDFFDSIVDMIPAKLYVAGNTGDEAYNPKYYKGQHKESKESRRARNKAAKRAKFDPALAETTLETKERLLEEERKEMEKEGFNTTAGGQGIQKSSAPADTTTTTTNNKSRVEALRAKLQAKIAEKRAQRPQASDATISKRAARRAEKQRRQQQAKMKAASSYSKAERIKQKKLELINSSSNTAILSSPMQDLKHVDFGKLAGLKNHSKYEQKNKSLSNLNKSKNLEKMLKDAQEKKKRLEQLKQSGEKEQAQQLMWGDAFKEASGERVKDDPNQIKKLMRSKAAKKTKSQKAWKSRMATTQQKMDDRQTIRSHNLSQRKLGGSVGANLSKKRIVTDEKEEPKKKKKRLSRAGFEGKKQGFLNKGGKE